MTPIVYINIFRLTCLLILLNGCSGQGNDVISDDSADCRTYRLQQYFCVARCISFVREDAPSSQVSYKGSCTLSPLAGGGSQTSADGEPCKSSMDYSPLTGCCTKDALDDLFIETDINACADSTKQDVAIVSAFAKDYVGNKVLNDAGTFDASKMGASYGLILDCFMKKFDMYSKTKLASKEVSDYLIELVKKSYKATLMDTISKCTASVRAKGDDYTTPDNSISFHTSNFMFFMCVRRLSILSCAEGSSKCSKPLVASLKNCSDT